MAIVPTLGLVDRPQAFGYDGSIDNVLIRLAVTPQTPIEDLTAPATAPRIDTAEFASDIKDETGQRYSRENLSGGAGLDFLHERSRPADAVNRYWDSRGVDVFDTSKGGPYGATLMHAVNARGSAWTDVRDIAEVDGLVYYLRDAGIYEEAGDTQEAALANATRLVGMGNSLYTLDPVNGVRRYPVATFTPVSVSSTIFDDIWVVKSRVLGTVGNLLYDTTDETTPVLSLPTDETVTAVLDVGAAILAFASTGNVHAFTLDSGLALVPAGETKFVDEVPYLAAETFGTLGIATVQTTDAGGVVTRFYTATVGLSGQYELDNIQLQFQIGDRATTDNLTPNAIASSRDSFYVVIPEEGEANTRTVWRYYLPTGGYARAHELASTGAVRYFLEHDDRMYFACALDLYVEADTYVTEGYVIGPIADFFTSDEKQWIGAELTGDTVPTGTVLELYDTTDISLVTDPDSTSWAQVHVIQGGNDQASTNSMANRQARYHAAKIVLRSDATRAFAPTFRSYSFRALASPDRDVLMRIPINVSDQIESTGRRATRIPGRGDAMESALRVYEGKQVLIELYRPALKIRGQVEQYEQTIETISPRGSVRRIMYARIRGSRVDDTGYLSGATTDGESLGQTVLGLSVLGIGDPQ